MKTMNQLQPSMNIFKMASVALVLMLSSCSDFGDINRDPNNPSNVKTELLMTNALTSLGGQVGDVTGTLYVQYIAEKQYDDAARYASTTFDFNGWYTGPLMDLQTIINLNTDAATKANALSGGSNNNQIAVARILKAYYYASMTDRWGMIPYTEALKGNEGLRPKYDTQTAIYTDLLKELREALAQIDGGAGPTGDFLFKGNMNSWKSFANSLRMRLAMRLSDSNATLGRTEFAAAVSAGHITSDVMYPFLSETANQNPWFARFLTRTDYCLSDVMANQMKGLKDYRVTKYGDPAPNKDNKDGVVSLDEIVGMPYSIANPGSVNTADVSFPGRAIRGAQNTPLPIITMAEINFLKAEGVERGWISGTAKSFYDAGIEASWRQWGVYDATNFAAFMANASVAYSSSNWQEKIGTQKWVALFPNGFEAWSEWRRLDFPKLTPHARALNSSGKIPVRHAYPVTEVQLNDVNYKAAVAAQGADNGDTRVWWDIK